MKGSVRSIQSIIPRSEPAFLAGWLLVGFGGSNAQNGPGGPPGSVTHDTGAFQNNKKNPFTIKKIPPWDSGWIQPARLSLECVCASLNTHTRPLDPQNHNCSSRVPLRNTQPTDTGKSEHSGYMTPVGSCGKAEQRPQPTRLICMHFQLDWHL
jgi:hypothetical protein